MVKDAVFELSDYFSSHRGEFLSCEDKRVFFKNFASKFGLGHITYFADFSCWGVDIQQQLITTYRPDWEHHYFSHGYEKIDPVLTRTMSGIGPLDWQQIAVNNNRIRDFFGDAGEFGINKSGLSVPIRGPSGDIALLAITFDGKKNEWDALKHHIKPDLMYLSSLIHAEVYQEIRCNEPIAREVELSAREREVLVWSARGKTSREIATILGVSQRTVEFHVGNALVKLDCINKTQAVSEALSRGLIKLPFQKCL